MGGRVGGSCHVLHCAWRPLRPQPFTYEGEVDALQRSLTCLRMYNVARSFPIQYKYSATHSTMSFEALARERAVIHTAFP